MTTPFITDGLAVHAYAKVSAATPPVVTDPVNIDPTLSITRTSTGVWVVNLGTEIDFTQRAVSLVVNQAAAGQVQLDPAVQTDSTIGVLGFIDDAVTGIPAAGDVAWEIKVERVNQSPAGA